MSIVTIQMAAIIFIISCKVTVTGCNVLIVINIYIMTLVAIDMLAVPCININVCNKCFYNFNSWKLKNING